MGTPQFAIPSLELIKKSGHHLTGLVTQPDRAKGRGRKVTFGPAKTWALENDLEVWQPASLKDEDFLTWLREKNPDLIVTVAYGNLLNKTLLELPPLGAINLHASYLPAYRGAAPIHRAVIEGAPFSGVSIISLTPELDGGAVIMQEKEEITLLDTAGALHDRLALKGARLLVEAINAMAAGTYTKTAQDPKLATYASPLSRLDERLDWNDSALNLYNRIRGLNPWPGAYTLLCGQRVKVWKAAMVRSGPCHRGEKPGTILEVGPDFLTVATGTTPITLLDLQPAGKKLMDAGSFCCGYRIEPGVLLGTEN